MIFTPAFSEFQYTRWRGILQARYVKNVLHFSGGRPLSQDRPDGPPYAEEVDGPHPARESTHQHAERWLTHGKAGSLGLGHLFFCSLRTLWRWPALRQVVQAALTS